MRFVCIADLHGHLPVVPPCDILVVGGDICPVDDERPEAQARWLRTTFARWLAEVPAGAIVGVAGNHDFVGESDPAAFRDLDWHYLQDDSVEIDGLTVHGSPWTSRYEEWAFMLSEDELAERWSLIPDAVDVLCLHSPPLGYGDRIDGTLAIGSPSLLEAIDARAPALCVYGHVHDGYGRWQRHGTVLVNAAHCDMDYNPVNTPIVVDLVPTTPRTRSAAS
jgi:Icc-related predicted phosphoesterase